MLLNLINRLPRDSQFVEAQAADEEFARAVLALPTSSAVPPPRWSEWTPERQALVDIFDRLGDLIATLVATSGGRAPTIRRHPRPITAVDRLRDQVRMEKHRELVARVLPPRPDTEEGGD